MNRKPAIAFDACYPHNRCCSSEAAECQQQYISQFTFATEIPSFTVERVTPALSDAEYNTQCFGDTREWEVKVPNTCQETTLPNIRVHLQSGSYGTAGLSVIYENTIKQEASQTCRVVGLKRQVSLDYGVI